MAQAKDTFVMERRNDGTLSNVPSETKKSPIFSRSSVIAVTN